MKRKSNPYSVHPGVKMIQDWTESLPTKTGKTLKEWTDLVIKTGPQNTKERQAWLKENYGFGTNTAWWIAENAEGKSPWEGDPESYLKAAEHYVQNMFAGKKNALLPIYDKLLNIVLDMATDIRICPCKTIVPIYRHHVFAQIKPTTIKRIDLGFALGSTPFTERLIDTGGSKKKDRITHCIAITNVADIDDEVIHLLKKAYQQDSKKL